MLRKLIKWWTGRVSRKRMHECWFPWYTTGCVCVYVRGCMWLVARTEKPNTICSCEMHRLTLSPPAWQKHYVQRYPFSTSATHIFRPFFPISKNFSLFAFAYMCGHCMQNRFWRETSRKSSDAYFMRFRLYSATTRRLHPHLVTPMFMWKRRLTCPLPISQRENAKRSETEKFFLIRNWQLPVWPFRFIIILLNYALAGVQALSTCTQWTIAQCQSGKQLFSDCLVRDNCQLNRNEMMAMANLQFTAQTVIS